MDILELMEAFKQYKGWKRDNSIITVGIDCGLKGGVAIFKMGMLDKVYPMPTIDNRKEEIDVNALFEIIVGAKTVFVEKQFSPHQKSQKGMETNIKNFGKVLAVAGLVCEDVEVINATQWKTYYNLNNKTRNPLLSKATKVTSVIKCNELFGTEFKKAQDGMAEAVLIGNYGNRKRNAQ